MGNNVSCIPRRRRHRSRKRRSEASRYKWEPEQPDVYTKLREEPAADQTDATPQAETRPVKEAKPNDKAEMEMRLRNDPIMEWNESGMNLEDLGKMIHCSRVKICRQPCKDINERCLALFQNHLLILSEDFCGFTYQGMLPLSGIMVNSMENTDRNSEQNPTFQITGPLLHPFTIYCSTEQEVKEWLYHLNKQRQVNGKVVDSPQAQTCRTLSQNSLGQHTKNVDLRTLILNRPIQGGKRTCIDSLDSIVWISEAKLQHLPFQDQHERLLILFPTTLLILSEENQLLHYKGELPLNAITIRELDETDNDPNTFLIEGKMINQIKVISENRTAHRNLIHHLDSVGVTVQKASRVNKGHDCRHSPECRDKLTDKQEHSLEPLEPRRHGNSPTTVYGVFTFPQKPVEMISVSEDLPTPVTENVLGPLASPDYAEPYTPPPPTFLTPAEPLKLTLSVYKHKSSPLPIRGSSMRFRERNVLTLSQPPPSSENTSNTENCWSPGYAEPIAALKWEPAPPGSGFPHRDMVNSRDPSNKHQARSFKASGSNISRLSPVSRQPGRTTISHCSPGDESVNDLLSPTYAVPYVPFTLRPAPPANPLWLREPVSRHSSSRLPRGGEDRNVPLRKTLALSQPPAKPNHGFGKNRGSFTATHQDVILSPVYAVPFAAAKKQPAPSALRLSATAHASKQNGSLAREQWSDTRGLGLECLPRSSLPSSSQSESSSCSYLDENAWTNPCLHRMLNHISLSQCLLSTISGLGMKYRGEEPLRFLSNIQKHVFSLLFPDDSSEYYAILQLLDIYREGKNISWYSDDSRYSLTSSEHTYAELESVPDDTDYAFWDFDFKQQDIPHLPAPTLLKLRQRGIVDSRLQGKLHRWS